jgi:hypothetical protein
MAIDGKIALEPFYYRGFGLITGKHARSTLPDNYRPILGILRLNFLIGGIP